MKSNNTSGGGRQCGCFHYLSLILFGLSFCICGGVCASVLFVEKGRGQKKRIYSVVSTLIGSNGSPDASFAQHVHFICSDYNRHRVFSI